MSNVKAKIINYFKDSETGEDFIQFIDEDESKDGVIVINTARIVLQSYYDSHEGVTEEELKGYAMDQFFDTPVDELE